MNTLNRRSFLRNSGMVAGAGLLLPNLSLGKSKKIKKTKKSKKKYSLDTWDDIRAQFKLNPDRIHMAQMLFASHPKPVREAIKMHRHKLDEDTVEYLEENLFKQPQLQREAAAEYLKADPEEIVLTNSTTMGLAILYHGLKLKAGDEIVTTTHDHYVTEKSLEFSAKKNGAIIKRIAEFDDPYTATIDGIVGRITGAITPKTRVVAITWVQSCTGVKLPIRAIADAIKEINAKRSVSDRIYFCVDCVHGFGIEDITAESLGCDFFSAGTHKWLFGPRGTGILWGKKEAWDMVNPTIPSFGIDTFNMWLGNIPQGKINFSDWVSPGGFHPYENEWAVNSAFQFHLDIGKKRIQDRTHQLNTMLKEGLTGIKHIKLHTPMSADLSAGINCFEVNGMKPDDVVKKLLEKNIISSSSPYQTSYVRLTPSIINTEDEVRTCIRELEILKA